MYFCIYDESKLPQVGSGWSWADKAGIPFYLLPAHCPTTLPIEPASTLPTSINCQGFAEHTWKSPRLHNLHSYFKLINFYDSVRSLMKTLQKKICHCLHLVFVKAL